ncbi:MAG: sulfotransferase [Dehalococcoidia bacterium]|nr:sulfotransferase [Dehalococcoidia bacterium]
MSLFLARRFETLTPSILILSLPRSGSSWVGEILGSAGNALYLSEPIAQSDLTLGRSQDTAFDPSDPPPAYKRFADRAFCGLPTFPKWLVLRKPNQWSLFERHYRRLVIKEVKPLACGWLLKRYNPRVIFLVRHPMAVALSYLNLGWTDIHIEKAPLASRGLANTFLSHWEQHLKSVTDFWDQHGTMQGALLRSILDSLIDYPDQTIVLYEQLCADPIKSFQNLFTFAGLSWDGTIERLITKTSSSSDNNKEYGTSRDSRSMVNAWKGKVSDEEVKRLRAAFMKFDLPWYGANW